jgi:hypothetical protein
MLDLLTIHERTVNSQFGEDGIINECLRRLDISYDGTAFDVGASDGRECSNTLELRDVFNWKRILVEADDVLFKRIERHKNDLAMHKMLTPTGSSSIDFLAGGRKIDFLSLDIDGNEFEVLRCMEAKPRLICAEFNQTIPWQYDVWSAGIGCSLSALCKVMQHKGYGFIGATHCNAFYVRAADLKLFNDIDRRPESYLSQDNFTYLVTTPYGGAVAFGPQYFSVIKRFSGVIDVVDPNTGEVRVIDLSHRSARPW